VIRVGIYGATGYVGYELLGLLAGHGETEIAFATSRSSAGQRLSDLYPCFPNPPYDGALIAPENAVLDGVDAMFTCLPHGQAMGAVKQAWDAGVRAIDLSADYRLRDVDVYQRWYQVKHVAPELLEQAVYGLVEVYRNRLSGARLIASPGCYPTGSLLALYPLARGKHLSAGRIIIDAKSGVSGAGRKLSLTTHFCEVNENFSAYKIGRAHRHTSELDQELAAWGGSELRVTFSPHLLPVNRGILSTIYVSLEHGWSVPRLVDLYQEVYEGEPFVHVLPAGNLASLAHVVRTNRCAISFAEVGDGDFIIVSAIDNLIKGAAGQALQSMNVMFGLDETMGLLA
jgi:N-acetyl-gamma-glutamyl-phosphate reductase